MIRGKMRMTAAVCLTVVACANGVATEDPVSIANAIEGLWSGSWGAELRDGVVIQPVRAELLIQGDQVEVHGFPNVGRLTGTLRFDTRTNRIKITPTVKAEVEANPKAIEYACALKGDLLTLIDGNKVPIYLQRAAVAKNPLANTRVELVAAAQINDAGDLVVTVFTVLRAGRAGATHFRPQDRSLRTTDATVLLVEETGLRKVTVDKARRLIRPSTPVVVTYRHADDPSPWQLHHLWKDVGAPRPDSEAVGQTFARLLRPGTLIFVLSGRETAPQP